VPPDSSISRTYNYPKKDESSDGGSSPTRQFLENSKKCETTPTGIVYAFNLSYISCNYQYENKRYSSAPLT